MKNNDPIILYYHSVAPRIFTDWCLKQLTVLLPIFEDQLRFLRKKRYEAVFLDDWMRSRKREKTFSKPTVCLVLDDGFLDNWVYAYPLAKKYGIKITLFVSPDRVDPREIVRPTLEDVWSGNSRADELDELGYASWQELRIMQESGVVDIQSHTMTHLKYAASDRLKSFYSGNPRDAMHTILGQNLHLLTSYMNKADFGEELPLGYPLFEEKSAVVTPIHHVNPAFIAEIDELARQTNLAAPGGFAQFEPQARKVYKTYQVKNQLIADIESNQDFRARIEYEVVQSKKILEDRIGKPVQFLCWPHGENSMLAHEIAIEAGYHATTSGKLADQASKTDRMPRVGAAFSGDKIWFNRQKFRYKIGSHFGQQPYRLIADLKARKTG